MNNTHKPKLPEDIAHVDKWVSQEHFIHLIRQIAKSLGYQIEVVNEHNLRIVSPQGKYVVDDVSDNQIGFEGENHTQSILSSNNLRGSKLLLEGKLALLSVHEEEYSELPYDSGGQSWTNHSYSTRRFLDDKLSGAVFDKIAKE